MKRGFVLLELILVIILLGIALTLIAPSLSRFSKSTELRSTAQKVAAILRHSRTEAIHKGKVYQVLFSSDPREIRVLSREPDTEGVEEEKTRRESPLQIFLLPNWISVEEIEIKPSHSLSEQPTIEFYPNGGSNGGSFLLKGEAQTGYRIKVHLITGMVEIERV